MRPAVVARVPAPSDATAPMASSVDDSPAPPAATSPVSEDKAVQGLGFGVEDGGLRVGGWGSRVVGCRIEGVGLRAWV